MGVVVVMVLEKGFEGRHEHGGVGHAIQAALQGTDCYHVWINSICIAGALLFYNILSVIRAHLGEGGLLGLFRSPLPIKSLKDLRSNLPAIAVACLGLAACVGCHSVGPRTIPRDRSDYSGSISESWKRQTLLNIVKLRYLDPPIFVDVGQIVAGYSLETGLNAGASFPENAVLGGNSTQLGGSVKFTDRPTITYTPMTGDKFLKALMTPLPPESVFFTIESGWPADSILFTAVARLNGLRNQEESINGLSRADPRFLRVLELMRRIQEAGAMGMRVVRDTNDQQSTLVAIHSKEIPEQTQAEGRELRQLLGLSLEAIEFKLGFGSVAVDDCELAIQTRSLLHILGLLAAQVEVPAQHIAEGRAVPGVREAEEGDSPVVHMARIQSSRHKPDDAYVAVPYRDHWFWIDDCDLKSKRTFAFMMMLFTLSDSGTDQNLPLITIPAQ
jgi:hypothetical protein